MARVILLIALTFLAAYLTGFLLTARFAYRRMRPWTEPLACTTPATCRLGHQYDSCYRRYGLIDTTGEAFGFSLIWGLTWPFLLPGLAAAALVRPFITSAGRDLPAERDARIGRLEREMEIGQ